MTSDLSLFFLALGKAALNTGFLPAILFFYAARMWVSAFGVPAPKLFGKVVSDGKAKDGGEEEFFVGEHVDQWRSVRGFGRQRRSAGEVERVA
jgi:hypothetical protein